MELRLVDKNIVRESRQLWRSVHHIREATTFGTCMVVLDVEGKSNNVLNQRYCSSAYLLCLL